MVSCLFPCLLPVLSFLVYILKVFSSPVSASLSPRANFGMWMWKSQYLTSWIFQMLGMRWAGSPSRVSPVSWFSSLLFKPTSCPSSCYLLFLFLRQRSRLSCLTVLWTLFMFWIWGICLCPFWNCLPWLHCFLVLPIRLQLRGYVHTLACISKTRAGEST